jgi:hypothetical protein
MYLVTEPSFLSNFTAEWCFYQSSKWWCCDRRKFHWHGNWWGLYTISMFYRQGWTQGELCFQTMFLVFFQHLILSHLLLVFIEKAVCRQMAFLVHWQPCSICGVLHWCCDMMDESLPVQIHELVLLDCYYQAMTSEGIEGLVFAVVICRVCSFRESVIIICTYVL